MVVSRFSEMTLNTTCMFPLAHNEASVASETVRNLVMRVRPIYYKHTLWV